MMQDLATNHVVLCTGNTAVLDAEYFDQLEVYLLSKDLTISADAIVHGSDRSRGHMIITHQSTANTVNMHARFNVMNLNVILQREQRTESSNPDAASRLTLLHSNACYGIGYHQGCYCLRLLSLSDVPSTLLRMMIVFENLKNRLYPK